MDPADKRAEWQDLLGPPAGTRAEILVGRIVSLPPPLPEHGRAQGSLGRFIGGPFDYDGGPDASTGWWIPLGVAVRLGRHDIARPDLAGWRRDRLPEPWGQRPIDVVPDWICEIISPSNETHDRVYKADLYAKSGVPFYWIVNPSERILEAFRNDDRRWIRLGAWDTGTARIPPFDAIELDVSALCPPASR